MRLATQRPLFGFALSTGVVADGRPVRRVVTSSYGGSHFTFTRYGERPAEVGAIPSIGTVGDSYDDAMIETANG